MSRGDELGVKVEEPPFGLVDRDPYHPPLVISLTARPLLETSRSNRRSFRKCDYEKMVMALGEVDWRILYEMSTDCIASPQGG